MGKEHLILLSGLVTFLIGLYVFLKKKDKWLGLNFFAYAVITGLWSLGIHYYWNPSLSNQSAWREIFSLLTLLGAIELAFLIISISKKPIKNFKIPLTIFLVLVSLIFSFLYFGIIKNQLIPFSVVFFLFIFLYLSWGAAILLFRKAISNHLENIYLIISSGLFITASGVTSIIPFLAKGRLDYSWMVSLFSLSLIAFLALTIDKNLILGEGLATLSTVIIGTILFSFFFLVKAQGLKIASATAFFLFLFISQQLLKVSRERKKEIEKEEQLIRERTKLSEEKNQFLLSIQHHLRTPIVPIKGYLEMILNGRYGKEENPVIKEKLIEIKKSIDELYFLIERLLDVQEMETGKKILDVKEYKIEDIIESVIKELKPSAEKKGLYINYEKIPNLRVKLDEKRTREIIWNLIDNAIKYTISGGVTIKEKVENKKLKIYISDTGIGMKKEEIDHFINGEIFERGERAKKLFGPGRGIGLNISRKLLSAEGGKISVESKGEDQGTTFLIELPS